METKLCDLCGESPAVVHLKDVENKQIVHRDLCRRCAEKQGFSSVSSEPESIQNLAEKLVTMAKDVSGKSEADGVRCASCGLLYSEFTKTGRLGCATCYTTFHAQLKTLLRKTHGATVHKGTRPGGDTSLREERRHLRALKTELERAVRREEYERAAEIRDEIESLTRDAKSEETR